MSLNVLVGTQNFHLNIKSTYCDPTSMNELKFNDYMISFLPGLCYEVLSDEDNILEYFDVKKHQEKIQIFEHISIGGLISKSFSLWPKSP